MKYILALSFLLSACASYEILPSGIRVKTMDEYNSVVEDKTDHVRRYNGFYNTIDMQGTLLDQEVLEAQIDQNTRLYQWDEAQREEARQSNQQRLATQTEVFLSFFTPSKKDDNLSKLNNKWKIFMDVDGRRYEGQVKDIKQLVSETQRLYPYYVRLATPYLLTFNTPMTQIEGKAIKITVTGPVDSAVLNFNSTAD